MTTRAVRLVSPEGPGCRLGVPLVTIPAGNRPPVVARIIPGRMPETDRHPPVGGVARITLQAGPKMGGRFSRGRGAVVTGCAASRHRHVIEIGRNPGQGAVAGIALP